MIRRSTKDNVEYALSNFDGYVFYLAESTIQQRDIPQPPPPPKLGAGIVEEEELPDPVAQLKEEITFFTSLEEHLGHSVFFSAGDRL